MNSTNTIRRILHSFALIALLTTGIQGAAKKTTVKKTTSTVKKAAPAVTTSSEPEETTTTMSGESESATTATPFTFSTVAQLNAEVKTEGALFTKSSTKTDPKVKTAYATWTGLQKTAIDKTKLYESAQAKGKTKSAPAATDTTDPLEEVADLYS